MALTILVVLAFAQGGREIIGLGLYHIFSLLFFYASVKKENLTSYKTELDIPVLAFLFVCGFSAIISFFTYLRGGIHFATILIHAINFYSLSRIKEERFECQFLNLTVLAPIVLSIGILCQLFAGEIFTFFFPNQNLLASFLNCGILITLARLGNSPVSSRSLQNQLILIAAFGILFFVELIILSRGALFSLCCALLFLVWREIKAKRFFLIFFLGISSLLALLHPTFRNAFLSKLLSSPNDSRIVIYQTAWKAFMQKPFLGWGLGSFGQVYEQFKLPIEEDIARYEKSTAFAHNEYLELLVETGILGLGCFWWLIVVILKTGFDSLKTTDHWCKVAAFSCLIALLTHAMLDFNLHLPILAYLMIFCAAILVPFSHRKREESETRRSRHLSADSWVWRVGLLSWGLVCLLTLCSELFVLYAGSQKQKGKLEKAAQLYKVALFFNPFSAQSFYELAQISENKEKEKWLKKAIQRAPANSNFHRDLGLYYLQQGKISQAIECYRKAIEKNPKKVFYYGELALTYLQIGQTEPAQMLLQEAIRIEPFYLLAHQKLSELYLRLGNKKLSEKHLLAVKKIQNAKLIPTSDYSKRLLSLE